MTVVSFLDREAKGWLEARDVALFLDLDGTLVDIRERPTDVRADSACVEMLHRAARVLNGRVAVLSGRTVAEVDDILGGAVANVAGIHGLQLRTARWGMVAAPAHPAVSEAAAIFDDVAASDPGLIVERKGQSVALHYRLAPGAATQVVAVAEQTAADLGLSVQHGSMVAELRTPGPDKGSALSRLMGHPPFAGAKPVMIGDDLTDEAAFVEAQLRGGVGVLVGSGRPTAATACLKDPADVRAWIDKALSSGIFELGDARWVA